MEKIQRKTIPLINDEIINAYDYCPHNDSIVVSTNSSLSVYYLNENGNPFRVAFYDELGPVSHLKLQNSLHPLVCTVKSNIFSLWDVEQRISSLVNCVGFDSVISSLNWSYVDSNLLTTGFENGVISTWDIRALQKPAVKFELGTSQFKSLKWCPLNSNFIASTVYNKYLAIFDLRMTKKTLHLHEKNPDSPINEADCFKLLDFESPLMDFSWSMSKQAIWTLCSNRTTELWKPNGSEPIVIEKLENLVDLSSTDWKITKIRPAFDDSSLLHRNEKYGHMKILLTDKQNQYSFGRGKSSNFLGFAWRNPAFLPHSIQHSFFSISSSGFVYITDWTFEDFNVDEAKYLRSGVSESQHSKVRRKTKISNLKVSINDDPETFLNELNSIPVNSPSAIKGAARSSGVVGPLTFLSLLGDDIMIVNNARKDGSLDGLKIASVDQFRRQIEIEFLLPTSDGFSITTKNSSAFFNSYYTTEELLTFFNERMPERTLSLTIQFPLKYSHFWMPKFFVVNNSSFQVFINLDTRSFTFLFSCSRRWISAQH
jgi:hypothetical protein